MAWRLHGTRSLPEGAGRLFNELQLERMTPELEHSLLMRALSLVQEHGTVNRRSIHGPSHWHNVEANAVHLAGLEGVQTLVPRMFAIFHDFLRENDNEDPGHGPRAAEFLRIRRDRFPEMAYLDFEALAQACERHTVGDLAEDPMIGICWDADRLDLIRVGITPDPKFMSTPSGKRIAYNMSEFGEYEELEEFQVRYKSLMDFQRPRLSFNYVDPTSR
jgi:uncharacterized protein